MDVHVPGAVYAHMEEDLSGPGGPGKSGKHPLPSMERFAKTLSGWGIDQRVQVVAYDDSTGVSAARLWWMLRWAGHDNVAVLDGGLQRWRHEGRPVCSGAEQRPPRSFKPAPRPELNVGIDDVMVRTRDPAWKVFDSRTAERYRGEKETVYPVAGHIPGALNAPQTGNVGPDGLFRSREELRQRFESLAGNTPPERLVFYCGAGVSAAHNLLAFAYAGLGDAKLYVGSWSEWIADPARAIETGQPSHFADR